jgi:hypothetical protein
MMIVVSFFLKIFVWPYFLLSLFLALPQDPSETLRSKGISKRLSGHLIFDRRQDDAFVHYYYYYYYHFEVLESTPP